MPRSASSARHYGHESGFHWRADRVLFARGQVLAGSSLGSVSAGLAARWGAVWWARVREWLTRKRNLGRARGSSRRSAAEPGSGLAWSWLVRRRGACFCVWFGAGDAGEGDLEAEGA